MSGPWIWDIEAKSRWLIAAGVVSVLALAGCRGEPHTQSSTSKAASAPATAPSTHGQTVADTPGYRGSEPGSTSVVSFDGFTLDIPTGWDSTTRFDGAALLTAASSRVSPGDGALGIDSQRFMRPDDVLVSILEYPNTRHPASFRPLPRPPMVDPSRIMFHEGTPHAMFLRAYADRRRYFQVGVAFGRDRPTASQIALADRVLATLRVTTDSTG